MRSKRCLILSTPDAGSRRLKQALVDLLEERGVDWIDGAPLGVEHSSLMEEPSFELSALLAKHPNRFIVAIDPSGNAFAIALAKQGVALTPVFPPVRSVLEGLPDSGASQPVIAGVDVSADGLPLEWLEGALEDLGLIPGLPGGQ